MQCSCRRFYMWQCHLTNTLLLSSNSTWQYKNPNGCFGYIEKYIEVESISVYLMFNRPINQSLFNLLLFLLLQLLLLFCFSIFSFFSCLCFFTFSFCLLYLLLSSGTWVLIFRSWKQLSERFPNAFRTLFQTLS